MTSAPQHYIDAVQALIRAEKILQAASTSRMAAEHMLEETGLMAQVARKSEAQARTLKETRVQEAVRVSGSNDLYDMSGGKASGRSGKDDMSGGKASGKSGKAPLREWQPWLCGLLQTAKLSRL